MINHFKFAWSEALKTRSMPSKFSGVEIIYYSDFEKSLDNCEESYAKNCVEGLPVVAAKPTPFGHPFAQSCHFCCSILQALLAQFHALAGDQPFDRITHQKHWFHWDAALLEVGFDVLQSACTQQGV